MVSRLPRVASLLVDHMCDGDSPNEISLVVSYVTNDRATFCWLGDLEKLVLKISMETWIYAAQRSILPLIMVVRAVGYLSLDWMTSNRRLLWWVKFHPDTSDTTKTSILSSNSAGDVTSGCTGLQIHIYCSYRNHTEGSLDNQDTPDTHSFFHLGTRVKTH